jgi:hypothetical protein
MTTSVGPLQPKQSPAPPGPAAPPGLAAPPGPAASGGRAALHRPEGPRPAAGAGCWPDGAGRGPPSTADALRSRARTPQARRRPRPAQPPAQRTHDPPAPCVRGSGATARRLMASSPRQPARRGPPSGGLPRANRLGRTGPRPARRRGPRPDYIRSPMSPIST